MPPNTSRPGYKLEPFVSGFLHTAAGPVPVVETHATRADNLGAWRVRLGIGRGAYRVAPGLYAVGRPGADAPVLVTANYKLTFDAVRYELTGLDVWLLVLDTRGVNVWCAAGKRTFGTAEVIERVRATGLDKVVAHRELILPQLGAPGVNARKVRRGCGFAVTWGPVRAADIGVFLMSDKQAAPEMRQVDFPLSERLGVSLVEFANHSKRGILLTLLSLAVLSGIGPDVWSLDRSALRGVALMFGLLCGFLCGSLGVMALLPWLPVRSFALKGLLTGLVSALALLLLAPNLFDGAALALGAMAVSAWMGLIMTGSTTFTSPSGVEAEMRRHLPWILGLTACGLLLWLAAPWLAGGAL